MYIPKINDNKKAISNAKKIPMTPSADKTNNIGILIPKIRFWINDMSPFLNAINAVFCIPFIDVSATYIINIKGNHPSLRKARDGEKIFKPIRNTKATMIDMKSVIFSVVLYKLLLFPDFGKNLINPLFIPNTDKVIISELTDVMVDANPMSVDDIVRAATIQNNNPKKVPDAVFNIMAIELR
jgi:hypothetical protein